MSNTTAIAYDDNNIFLKIIKGEVPSYKVFETDDVLAILDAFPATPGHCLLLPKASGYATVMDMPADVAAKVYQELPRLARAVQAATGCEGINIVQNNGPAAGQVVFHAHIHVIPRNTNDGQYVKTKEGSAMIEADAANDLLKKLHASL